MNLNSKYGECCKCPAIMSDGRLFTVWDPTQQFHVKLSQKLNVNNNHDMRKQLSKQTVPISVYEFETMNNNLCNNQGNNLFNVDTSNYHQLFDKKMQQELTIPVEVDGTIERDLARW